MSKIKLEICCYDFESALLAQAAGADSIELCASPADGGITPSHGTIELTRNHLTIPVHVIIRPRAGDFNYNIIEYQVMKNDIAFCKHIGIDGVVFGILNSEKNIDLLACGQLIELAKPMKTIFHRAFDTVAHPLKSLSELIDIGFDGILTSGRTMSAADGLENIYDYVTLANNKIQIIAGGGIDEKNIFDILTKTHCTHIHSSAKKIIPANDHSLFSAPKQTIDAEKINIMKEICNQFY